MTFTAKDVAMLRQKTGAGMMECKSALQEANGNQERAREILRQKGLIQAAKKADKTALEGIVASKITNDKKAGVIIEINSQTDFVTKNESFLNLSRTILDYALTNKPKNLDELLNIKTQEGSIKDLISQHIAIIGENIQLRRFELFELKDKAGIIGTYIHPVGNKIGVLVKFITKQSSVSCAVELEELIKNIAMHIAASQPQPEFISKVDIPKGTIENERRIELGKEDLAKKPKEIAEKIVQGRLDKILAQRCLLDQPYIKDQAITIEKLLQDKGKKLNMEIQVDRFVRYNVSETIENKSSEGTKSTVTV